MLHRLRKLLNGVFADHRGNSLIFSPLPSNTDPMTSQRLFQAFTVSPVHRTLVLTAGATLAEASDVTVSCKPGF